MKTFRIVKTDMPSFGYQIEQRHTILFFIHYWTSPEFAPPHLFAIADDAAKAIWIRYPDAVIHDCYSETKTGD